MGLLRFVYSAVILPLGWACAIAAVLALGGRFSDRLDILTHFAPLYVAGGLLTAVAGLGAAQRHLALILAAAAIVPSAALMVPEFLRPQSPYAPADTPDETLAGRIAGLRGAQDYVAALLMDFATVDRELDDVPLAAAFENARRFGVEQSFETLSAKHLELPKRRVTKIKRDAASILEQAERRHG